MSDEAPAIGIDLGTTNSCAAVVLDGKVNIIHGDDGLNTTASFVFFKKNGEHLVGNTAKDQAFEKPENGIFGVKRFIGNTFEDFRNNKCLSMFPYTVVNKNDKPIIEVQCNEETKQFTPEEISAMILAKLKQRAEVLLRKTVTKAVITVPAHFNGTQRQATIDAGRIAGLKVLKVINEPTASILAFDILKNYGNKKCNILVYDFGGGTFDVTIASVSNNEIEVKASNGEAFLGGEDLNENLVEYFLKRFQEKHNMDLRKSMKAVVRLNMKAEITKKILSDALEHDFEIDCIDDNGDFDFECKVTRSIFQDINMDLFDKTLACVKKTLQEAKIKKEEIDEILLVGGSTRIPYVRELIVNYFDKEPNASVNPDEVVAAGAARQAAIIESQKETKNNICQMKITDVCSLSLGVGMVEGLMAIIIPKQTKLPAKKTEVFGLVKDYVTANTIEIYEGERPMYKDNKFLASFVLTDITPAPAFTQAFDYTFEIDESGILTATAEERGANNSAKTNVSIYKNNLSEREIEAMIKKAKEFEEQDKNKKALAELRTDLHKKCNTLRNTVGKLDEISELDKKFVLEICDKTKNWLELNCDAGKIEIEKKMEELSLKCSEFVDRYI